MILIVLGTGLLKPNISSIVGQLYARGRRPPRRGLLDLLHGHQPWRPDQSPRVRLPRAEDRLALGVWRRRHWYDSWVGSVRAGRATAGRAGLLEVAPVGASRLWVKGVGAVMMAGVGLWAGLALARLRRPGGNSGALPLVAPHRRPTRRSSASASARSWCCSCSRRSSGSGFEQAGSSLTLFADQNTSNTILGYVFPSSWYQSAEPSSSSPWRRCSRGSGCASASGSRRAPRSSRCALLFLSLGFLSIAVAAPSLRARAACVSAPGG